MYKNLHCLISLVLVLGLAALAWAEDLDPAPWRGEPGSTFSHWAYDSPPPNLTEEYPRVDTPEGAWYIPDSNFGNPDSFIGRAMDEGWINDWPYANYAGFSMQLWGVYNWSEQHMGRQGVLTGFEAGSWDIYNFSDELPRKDIRIQLTWQPMDAPVEEFGYELEWASIGLITEEWVESPEPEWNYAEWGDPEEVWEDEGVIWFGKNIPLPEDKWYEGEVWEFQEGLLVPTKEVTLDGWIHSTFDISCEPNPFLEFIGLFPNMPIAVDQVVIETITTSAPAN